MRIIFDTDVLLDLLLDRQPFSIAAAQLLSQVESGEISGYTCATAATTVHYLAARVVGAKRAKAELRKLLALLEIAPVNRAVLDAALVARFADFEDAVVHEAGRQVSVQAIVTRNIRDFRHSMIPVRWHIVVLHTLRGFHAGSGCLY